MFRGIVAFGIAAAVVCLSQAAALAAPMGASRTMALAAAPSVLGETIENVQYLPRSGFEFPRAGGAIVDWCANWAHDCGWGGAHQFCHSKGFDRALSFDIFHPGRTYVIGSNQYCDGDVCRGFRFVRCG